MASNDASKPTASRSRVEPTLGRGLQDHPPARQALRQHLVDAARATYERWGFRALETPSLERWDVLVGRAGEHPAGEIFAVTSTDEEELGLRFDLTVPLSRHVAAQQQGLARPYRRYQVGTVWRQDKPGPGRFREFVQCDADVVGTRNPLADAEVVAALRDVFAAILPDDDRGRRFQLRLSDRRILETLVARAGIHAQRAPDVFRVLDKLDRIGREKVKAELSTGYTDESGAKIPGLGLTARHVEVIEGYLEIGEGTTAGRREVLDELASYFGDTPGAAETVAAVRDFLDLLEHLDVSEADARLDPSIARGLAYYTGPVFEVGLRDAPSIGSVGSGGRYDDLVGRFSSQPWPGVGVSVGIDRLAAALEQLEQAPVTASGPEVLVTVQDRDRLPHSLAMSAELRAAGVRTETWCGDSKSFAKQLKHADRLGVPLVVIAGGDELARGVVTLKNMREALESDTADESREEWLRARHGQREVERADVVPAVRSALGHR